MFQQVLADDERNHPIGQGCVLTDFVVTSCAAVVITAADAERGMRLARRVSEDPEAAAAMRAWLEKARELTDGLLTARTHAGRALRATFGDDHNAERHPRRTRAMAAPPGHYILHS
jgi:hypothetical protein